MCEQTFYQNGLKFSCTRCQSCCGKTPGMVYLSERDLTSLCVWFKLEKDEFIHQYCRWVPYYGGKEALSLKEKKNYDCIFWDNGCTAYNARPIQCSTYPFWTWILKDKESWNNEESSCPGINKGELHSSDEINYQCALYKHNQPIVR
jgi:Fe-S-cluster containining protein